MKENSNVHLSLGSKSDFSTAIEQHIGKSLLYLTELYYGVYTKSVL